MKNFCGCLFTLCLHGLFWFSGATAYAGSISKRMLNACNARTPRPFFVIILTGRNSDSYCGGTAIRSDFVLTAAHCVHRMKQSLDSPLQLAEKITIVHADFTREENERQYKYWTLNMEEEPSPVYIYSDEHQSRRSENLENRIIDDFKVDIALLRLPQNERLNAMVLPLCDRDETPDQFGLKIVGLGHIDMEGNIPELLQEGHFKDAIQKLSKAIGWELEKVQAHPARIFLYDGDNDEVDKQRCVFYGDSGGPAFLVHSNEKPVCLYGVVEGTYRISKTSTERWNRNYLGINIVNYVSKWINKKMSSYDKKRREIKERSKIKDGLYKPSVQKIPGDIQKKKLPKIPKKKIIDSPEVIEKTSGQKGVGK